MADGSPLESVWAEVVAHWDDDAAHERFVAIAQTLDALPDAAGRYRAAAADPERKERAETMLGRITAIALATLSTMKPEADPTRSIRLGVRVVAVILFLLAVYASYRAVVR